MLVLKSPLKKYNSRKQNLLFLGANMKKKLICLIIFSSIITIIIYSAFKNDKITILALGDSIAHGITPYNSQSYSYNDYLKEHYEKNHQINKYYREFTGIDIRTNDLINMINNNISKKINGKTITIQQALVKSDIITISIGSYDLYNHLGITNGGTPIKNKEELNDYFLSMFTDLNNLIKLVSKYTAGRIIIIGFHNPKLDIYEKYHQIFEYLDASYQKISEENDVEYVSINQEISGNSKYLPNSNSIHFDYKAHEIISQKIIRKLDS